MAGVIRAKKTNWLWCQPKLKTLCRNVLWVLYSLTTQKPFSLTDVSKSQQKKETKQILNFCTMTTTQRILSAWQGGLREHKTALCEDEKLTARACDGLSWKAHVVSYISNFTLSHDKMSKDIHRVIKTLLSRWWVMSDFSLLKNSRLERWLGS